MMRVSDARVRALRKMHAMMLLNRCVLFLLCSTALNVFGIFEVVSSLIDHSCTHVCWVPACVHARLLLTQ